MNISQKKKLKTSPIVPNATPEPQLDKGEPVVTSAPPPIGQDGRPVALAVQSDASKPSEPAKSDVVSIVDVIKGLPEDKVAMAENLGVPVRPILKWMYQTEQTQNQIIEFLKKLGANMQQAQASGNVPMAQGGAGTNPLGMLGSIIPQLLGGGAGQLSAGDMYFMEMGREMASLGTFMTKEMMKRMMPTAFADWEKTIVPK